MSVGCYTPLDLTDSMRAVLDAAFPEVKFAVELVDAPVQGIRFRSTTPIPAPFWINSSGRVSEIR